MNDSVRQKPQVRCFVRITASFLPLLSICLFVGLLVREMRQKAFLCPYLIIFTSYMISSLMPCLWRRWTLRRSMGLTSPTFQLSNACGPTRGSRRPTTAAESTSCLTLLNSTLVCVFISLSDNGNDVCLGFNNGICVTQSVCALA